MTESEIDQLDGLDLRRAVAKAVGWEWDAGLGWGQQKDASGKVIAYRSLDSFDDAIEACEAAGMLSVCIVKGKQASVRDYRGFYYGADGKGSVAVCRALLKALAAKDPGYQWQPSDPVWPE